MIIYLIKSSSLLLLFYIFYLVINQEKRLQFNRFYLLTSLVLAYLLPVFDWTYVLEQPMDDSHQLIGEAYSYVSTAGVEALSQIERVNDQTSWNLWNSLYVVIIIGAMVMLLRFTRNLISLFRIIKSSDFRREEHHVFVLVDKQISPYSFLKYILLSKEDYCSGRVDPAIIQHELSHVKQLHSLDIILIELLSIPFWFNPILWEYGKAVRANHEYLADESVTQQIDVKSYSELLVHEIQKNTISLFGSSFNFFLTKKRILMMNRSKTSSYSFGYKLSGSILIFTLAFALLSLKPMRYYDIKADSFVVVIDAGHGGQDDGVTNEDAHLKEKDIVLDIITELSKKGDNNVSYVFTRDKDEHVNLTDRVKLAEDVNADLLISVHINSHPDKAINGVEIYYSKENPYLEKSKGYSKQFANGLKLGEGKNVIKAENLYVTRAAACPSVYLGLGFLSSDKDAEYLSSQKNREDIANQIHQVVREFSRM